MGPRTARRLAIPFVLLAFALRFVAEFWLEPFTWLPGDGAVGLLGYLALLVVSLSLPLAGYLSATRSARTRPATWQLSSSGFTAVAAPFWAGPWAVVLSWLAPGAVAMERVPGQDRMRITAIEPLATISLVSAVLVLAAVVVFLLLDRPTLTLDPAGLTLHRFRGPVTIGWPAITAPPTLERRGRTLVLPMPDGSRRLSLVSLHIDPSFLACTIARYLAEPDRRAEIGTEAELRALETAVSGPRTR